MPDEILPWSEENLCAALTKMFSKAIHDQTLHQQCMTDLYSVLIQYIQIPAEYQRNIFAKPQGKPGVMISVPPYQGDTQDEQASSHANVHIEYTIGCTLPIW